MRALWRAAARAVERPTAYSRLQAAVGSTRLWQRFVSEVVQPFSGMRILDVGCGPADVLDHLPADLDYRGIDTHAPYIEGARARHGTRGTFSACSSSTLVSDNAGPFDVVLALGLLHHLTDAEVRDVVADAALLAPGGRLVTLDGCREPGVPPWEAFFYAVDRGAHVRSADAYTRLLASGGAVEGSLWAGVLRVPYTHFVGQVRLAGSSC